MDRVLFDAVDFYGRMVGGRTEVMPLLQVCGVDVRAGIDDEGGTAGADFDAQSVVVAVRAAAVDARAAGVETEVQIFVPHDVNAGMRKRLRFGLRLAQRGIVEYF